MEIQKIIHKEDDVNIELVESPYSALKVKGELLIRAYQKCYGINFIIIRFSNIYGKYDISDRVVPLFIKLAKQNKNIIVYGKDKVLDLLILTMPLMEFYYQLKIC